MVASCGGRVYRPRGSNQLYFAKNSRPECVYSAQTEEIRYEKSPLFRIDAMRTYCNNSDALVCASLSKKVKKLNRMYMLTLYMLTIMRLWLHSASAAAVASIDDHEDCGVALLLPLSTRHSVKHPHAGAAAAC